MRQMEREIRVAEDLQRQGRNSLPSFMVRFNPWRHDKQEALWAAFALEFIRQVQKQCTPLPRWWSNLKLFRRRYSWKSGWIDLVRAVFLWLCFLSVAAVVGFLAFFRGPEYVHTVVDQLEKTGKTYLTTLLDWIFYLSGVSGCVALLAYLLALVRKHVGNPLEVDLQKHLKSAEYEGSVSFVERFHNDFSKVVKAYAGKRRVYVFVDDLDRCEVPKAADLMQAINMMVSSDPQLVFVIGMDWETVAAGIAVKYARLAQYLRPSAAPRVGALELGREFVEKFIQLRFALPRPGDDELKRFLQTLSLSYSHSSEAGTQAEAR